MENKKEHLKTYLRLLKVARLYLPAFLLGVGGTLLLSASDAGLNWLIKPIINKGFVERSHVFLMWLPVMVFVIFIFRAAFGFMSAYFIQRVARNVVMTLRQMLFHKMLKMPAKYYDKFSSAKLLSIFIYNVEQVAQASSDVLLMMMRESTYAIGSLAVMFVISWKLSLIFVITAPSVYWVLSWSSKRLRHLSKNVQDAMGEVSQVADEAIKNYKVIKIYGGQAEESKRMNEATLLNRRRELKIVVTNSIGSGATQLLMAIPLCGVLVLASMPFLHITAGGFAAIVFAMISLTRPMRRLTSINSELQKGVAGATSIFEILDKEEEVDTGIHSIAVAKGLIEYRNVFFAYGDEPVLNNINFTVKSGQVIALVGRSGSGKTTIANLLPRFYEVQSGEILLDGINIRQYKLEALRNQFAFVSQQTTLFDDTIANNIAFGAMRDVSERDIIAAAESAYAMEFIEKLPQGIHTMIGQDGVLLSGGQRQRIAIARAILKDAPLLILDEATSALDTHSERHIQSALETLMKHRTTLVIAHRLSTVEHADSILVVDHGTIIESGSHSELLKQQGAYAELYAMQFKDKDTESLVEN